MPEQEEEHAETEHQEEEHTEDEREEDECDEAIAGLLERISELEQRIERLEQQLTEHGIKFKHEPIPESSGPGDVEPEPAHWYFKRVRRD